MLILKGMLRSVQAVHSTQNNQPKLHCKTGMGLLSIDFAGSSMNKMFLIVIDLHSKWSEVKIMNTIMASDTVIELKEIFATHGLPDQIVSDYRPSFTAH